MGRQPPNGDPGWPSIGTLLLALVPGYVQRLSRTRDQLVSMRAVFVSFSASLVVFAIVLHLIHNPGPNHVLPWLWLVILAAGLSITAIAVVSKPLDCTSDAKLALSYRSRFFLTIAFSQSVALFGFVFAFIGAQTWIYDLAAAFALFRFWTVEPPTARRLAEHQAVLTASGCTLSLVAALNGPPLPPQARAR